MGGYVTVKKKEEGKKLRDKHLHGIEIYANLKINFGVKKEEKRKKERKKERMSIINNNESNGARIMHNSK